MKLFFACAVALYAFSVANGAKDIVQTIAEQPPDTAVIVQAVTLANLTEALKSDSFTVFTPTDTAFLTTMKDLGYQGSKAVEAFQIFAEAISKPPLQGTVPPLADILKYHVVAGAFSVSQVLDTPRFTTLLGQDITVNKTDKTLGDLAPKVQDPKLLDFSGKKATNGYVHFIDRVLLPLDVDPVIVRPIIQAIEAAQRTPEPSPDSTPVPSPEDEICFPASAVVHAADGSEFPITELAAGHTVRVAENGVSSPVFLFSHKNYFGLHEFVRIKTQSGRSISLSPGHYIYANGVLVAARAVKVGDVLRTVEGTSKVNVVERVKDLGLVAPHTLHGDIMVNGIVASTYTTTVHPRVAKILLAPLRALVRTGLAREPIGSLLYDGAGRWARLVPNGPEVY